MNAEAEGTDEELGYRRASSWAGLAGPWTFDGAYARYGGQADPNTAAIGVAISDLTLRGGWINAEITLDKPTAAGRIVFGHDAASGAQYSAGIGGDTHAYVVDRLILPGGWSPVASRGTNSNLEAGRSYAVEVAIQGQHVWMEVDDVQVLSVELPGPLTGDQVGVIAWSTGPIEFSNLRVLPQLPEAFVVMQYGDPFDALYNDVIVPACWELGFAPQRADDVYTPGIILQDIISGLVRAVVVIAEITPANANVFYELGYAHALGKPTILLAERGRELPFDVSGYRCIFYDNTIGGKQAVDESLRRHLTNILTQGS